MLLGDPLSRMGTGVHELIIIAERLYFRHWLGAIAPDLVEGIEYSCMFYGGRLLSHLSADDADVTEFIVEALEPMAGCRDGQ